MIINHNMNAMNAHRNMTSNVTTAGKSMEKLSSGLRINRAGDDAAGLAISEKMRGQIRGLDQAQRNSQDGISLIQTAEGALQETHSILQRMKELATQSSTGTLDDSVDRVAIQTEVDKLNKEIDRISSTTNFNGIKLLDGTIGAGSTSNTNYNGTALVDLTGSALVATTAVKGVDVASGSKVTAVAGTAATDIKFTVTDASGNAKTTVLDMTKLITNKTTGAAWDDLTDGVKAGVQGVIDLSSVGLGKIEFTTTTTAGDAEVANFVTDLIGEFPIGTPVAFTGTPGAGGSLKLQVGDSTEPEQQVSVDILSMSSASLSVSGLDVSSQSAALTSINSVKDAINKVSAQRADLGATQNRLEHTINNLGTTSENLTAAESRIRDVDMAKEMTTYSKNNILTQAAQAMLAQAKSQPEQVLQLLR